MWLPSLRWKLRTQPTWSAGSTPSISEVAMIGGQSMWLLKSRSTAPTRAIGASITAERATRITSSSPEQSFQRIERRLEHALADRLGELAFALGRAVELGR